MNEMTARFWTETRANAALTFAIVLLPISLAAGVGVDYARIASTQADLQATADAATLMVARSYGGSTTLTDLADLAQSYLAVDARSTFSPSLVEAPTLSADGRTICLKAADTVPMTFMSLIGTTSVGIGAGACAALPADDHFEISLVVDVSSSMIENDRFAPMVAAVDAFVSSFADDPGMNQRTKIAIVPFSSRVNIGLPNTAWLTSFEGNPAVPARWTNPTTVYDPAKYTTLTWVDGVTVAAANAKNTYWMGCVEPRADVDIRALGTIGPHALSDTGPDVAPLVAMDHNTLSSKSFCPPPIVGLTNDFGHLKAAAAALTSQGSTRLDAGMMAGWYTLSPKWRGRWPDASAPLNAAATTHKIVVFMTDGQMNTQYGASAGKLDWLCSNTPTTACNTMATSQLNTVCGTMKATGIVVYTVSYDADADPAALASCATSTDHAFTATRNAASTDYIKTIYETIATSIRTSRVRLAS